MGVSGCEIRDNLGLLSDKIELICLQSPQHPIPYHHVLLSRPAPSSLRRKAQSARHLLRLQVVQKGYTAVAEQVSIPSHIIQLMQGQDPRKEPEQWQGKEQEQARRQLNLQDNVGSYAASLVQRISDPNARNERQTKELSKKIGHQIQSNICSICLQLMIPPLHNPIILFPCGHNICKDCLFERPPQGPLKKNLKLKLEKCSLCRQKITSYAVNQSLMTLICTYTNNKHLIAEQQRRMEQQEEEEPQEGQSYEQLKLRCAILEKELASLASQHEQIGRNKVVMGEVVQTLKREKRKTERQMEKVEQQGKLINKCLSQKVEQMECLEKQLKQAQDRTRVIDKALQPLLQEKQRQQLLLMQRLLSKK